MKAKVQLVLDPCNGYTPDLIRELVTNNGCSIPGPGCPVTYESVKYEKIGDNVWTLVEDDQPGKVIGETLTAEVEAWDHPNCKDYQWAKVNLVVGVDETATAEGHMGVDLLRYCLVEVGNLSNMPGLGGTVWHGETVMAEVSGASVGEIGA